MRVAFVNPAVAWDALDSSWTRQGLGLLSAIAKTKGHETGLIDLRRMSDKGVIDWSAFDASVKGSKADVYAVSVLSANHDFATECIKRIKLIAPDSTIIVGGIHPTIDEAAEYDAEYIIQGEGEVAFADCLDEIQAGTTGRKRIWGKQADLDSLPYTDRELFAPLRELPIGRLPEPFHTVIIGRGCPHICSFCQPAEKILFGPKVRMRSVDNVIGELESLRDIYGLSSYLIHDDCFSAFPKYALEWAATVKKRLPRTYFYCQARADHITKRPDMFKKLYAAGLRGCLIGMESGNQRVLDFLKKGTTPEMNVEAAKILNDIGITVWANLMVGIPTETKAEVMDTVIMAKAVKDIQPRAILSWASYTPHPGSELFKYCEDNDLSLVKKAEDYRRYFEGKMNPKIKGVDYGFLEWAVSR